MSTEEKLRWLRQIDIALDQVRPHLAVDGGNVEVLDVRDDMTVTVRWLGTCESCSMSHMTLKAGLEETLKHIIPEIHAVEAIGRDEAGEQASDHAQ